VIAGPKNRAWWLEITAAGTPQIAGKFVGAPGGQLDDIPDIKIENDQLVFKFNRAYKQPNTNVDGIYKATLAGGKLVGTFNVQDDPATLQWTGVRAPKLTGDDPAKYREGKPVELFNGKDLSGWNLAQPDKKDSWTIQDGVMNNVPGGSDLISQQKFWNFKLHAEYRLGKQSNSGIGLRGRYEVQIFDDHGAPPSAHGNGAIYSRIVPSTNASKPAGEWQSDDVTLIGNVVTVVLNGTTIIDRKAIEGLTAIATDPNESDPGPIIIQGDHGSVEFRKITVTPLLKSK
jgi:hypothetical protein